MSLGKGISLPLSEAKQMEMELLQETLPKHHHSKSKGILSSLLRSVQLNSDILNPLIQPLYDSISEPVLVVLLASSLLLYANKSFHQVFGNPFKPQESFLGTSLSTFLPDLGRDKLDNYMTQEAKDVMMDGRGYGGKFAVLVSFGRLAKEGLTSKSVSPKDIAVLTCKRTLLKSNSGSTISRYKFEFEEIKTLGKGAFGHVVQAKNKLDGQEYAIKKVRLNCSPENLSIFNSSPPSLKTAKWIKGHSRQISESDHRLLNEVKTFALLSNHPNVIRYHNAWVEPVEEDAIDDEKEYDSDSEDSLVDEGTHHHSTLFIQMQLCPYLDLRRWISQRNCVRLDTALNIFWQIVSGLVHIHSQGVIHRDVKPENIFIHNDQVFLGDFGLAKNISDHIVMPSPDSTMVNESFMNSTDDGTFFYMAPEIISEQTCTTKSDIYSLGVILFELLTHFETSMERAVTLNQLKVTGVVPDFLKELFPVQAALLAELIQADPVHRPSSQDILNNEVFYDVISRKGTVSSFGASGTDGSESPDHDPFASLGRSRRPHRKSETLMSDVVKASLQHSKSAVALSMNPQFYRERRATEDYSWMPWGPNCVYEEASLHHESPEPWDLLENKENTSTSHPVGLRIHVPSTLPTTSSSFIEKHSDPNGTCISSTNARDRIKSLERDVALLEAKLQAMTAHSLLLESELEQRDSPLQISSEMSRTSSCESNSLPIPIPIQKL